MDEVKAFHFEEGAGRRRNDDDNDDPGADDDICVHTNFNQKVKWKNGGETPEPSL